MYIFRGEVFIGELMIKEVLVSFELGSGLANGRNALLFIKVGSGLTYFITIFLLPLGNNPLLLGDSNVL